MTYPLTTLEAGDAWQFVAPAAELAQGRLPLAPALLGLFTTEAQRTQR
ncbi:hypothetical protein [Candidatus Viridilinea mediisalina]|nr:hypothetical protein [Candidatus Viridilinea mediisalina]